MPQAKDASSVEYRHLSPMDKKTYESSRKAELQGLLGLGASRILSLDESLAFQRDHPEYVLQSRWVDRWKGNADGSLKSQVENRDRRV